MIYIVIFVESIREKKWGFINLISDAVTNLLYLILEFILKLLYKVQRIVLPQMIATTKTRPKSGHQSTFFFRRSIVSAFVSVFRTVYA